jgi:hypothetical protein
VEPVIAGYRGVDISCFAEPLTPAERKRLLQEKFPSTAQLNWEVAFDQDIDLLGHLLKDILKKDMAVVGAAGRRPGLEEDEARPVLDRMMGRDPTNHVYSTLPFPATFALLIGERSRRAMQAKVGISKTRIGRLLRGTELPGVQDMERIAAAFHKQPSYFVEYRVQAIASTVFKALGAAPELSIGVYERLWQEAR